MLLFSPLIVLGMRATAGCPSVPPTSAREAAFVHQSIARTPSYLSEFSVPAAGDLMTTPAPATDGRWGLGYAIQSAGQGFPDGVERIGHDGGNRGWQTFFWVSRARRDGLIVHTNGSQ